MATQNLIVPQLSLGHGTQSYTAAPLSFSAVWAFFLPWAGALSPMSLYTFFTVRDDPSWQTSCFVPSDLALGAFTVWETKPETVFSV